jgi:hypothetical protein
MTTRDEIVTLVLFGLVALVAIAPLFLDLVGVTP